MPRYNPQFVTLPGYGSVEGTDVKQEHGVLHVPVQGRTMSPEYVGFATCRVMLHSHLLPQPSERQLSHVPIESVGLA